jgi:hypothetical protein
MAREWESVNPVGSARSMACGREAGDTCNWDYGMFAALTLS